MDSSQSLYFLLSTRKESSYLAMVKGKHKASDQDFH